MITVESRIAPGSGPIAGLASVSGAAFERGSGRALPRLRRALERGRIRPAARSSAGPRRARSRSGAGEDLLRPLIPDFTFPTGPAATNFPIPWTVSSRGFGFLIDQYERSTFRLASERADAWQAEAEADHFRFSVFAGPTPAAVVAALLRLRRAPARARRRGSSVRGSSRPARRGRSSSPTASARRTSRSPSRRPTPHYLPCGAQVGKREAERERVRGYHRLGYKITTYFNPHVCTHLRAGLRRRRRRARWFVRNGLGRPYLLTNPFTADQIVSEIDFTNPDATALLAGACSTRRSTTATTAGWRTSASTRRPTRALADGSGGLEIHNRYPVLYHCASYAHTRERMGRDAAVFIRSGWHGVQPCARVVWGGDPTEDWSCSDGLCAAVHQALSTGLSGIAYWGSDIGGFHAIVNPRTNDELNARWLELGAFSGVMRTQANGFSFGDDREERSQVWDPAVLPTWRRYAKLRTQLLPYIEAASRDYQRRGLPLTRHLALAFPEDATAVRQQEEFMFGPDLLVAPVIVEGARERRLYLPRGRWVDLWRSVGFGERRGALRLGRATLLRGGREITVPAPLEQIPLFARAGTVLPLLPPDVDTLADVGEAPGLVHLGERRRSLTLLAWPRGRTSSAFGERGKVRSIERRGGWELRMRAPKVTRIKLRASLATMKRPLRPCRVELNGRKLPRARWAYAAERRVLRLRFSAKRARLVVDGRC